MAYRSGLEERVAKLFDINNIPYTYESKKYKYVIEVTIPLTSLLGTQFMKLKVSLNQSKGARC